MIVPTTSALALPLLLVVWALDAYLFLALLRLVLDGLSGQVNPQRLSALRQLTDSIPIRVEQWLTAVRKDPCPAWVAWVIVVASALLVRHLLVVLVIGM